ncbi:MAG: polymer-forming cytoskeletal protein [Bacteroidales bacterium]|nr:polymer-forming cytoskeletal protein [Bacteroidales bacterium]
MNFNANNKPVKTVEQNVNDVSRISQGAAIRGDMTSSTDIRVDGQVDGTLYSDGKVVVGECARLSGKLFGTTIDFWGKMDGDIFVKDTLSLKSSSIVNGNIHVRRIQVEMGAQINGSFKMISEQEYDQLVATMVKKPAAPKAAAPKVAVKAAEAAKPAQPAS